MSTFEALRVANALEVFNVQLFCLESEREVVKASIDMIRRLYARVQELEAAQTQREPLSDELPKGFLSDVLTAAGLVSHGKQCKALGSRIGEAVESIWKISIQQREALPTHGITQEKHQ